MQIIADLHTHTLVSNHAFNTVTEMARRAHEIGLSAIALTDHGCAMPDSPHPWYFYGLAELPLMMEGIPVLKGAEANVKSLSGELDFTPQQLAELDWVIASIHGQVLPGPLSRAEATRLWRAVAENPYVDLIGHSELVNYEYDYDEVTKAFARLNKVVELNGNSCVARPAGMPNMRLLALACMKNGARVALNSDAHCIYRLGEVSSVLEILEEIRFPEELVVNSSRQRLVAELKLHGRPVAEQLGGIFHV